MKRKTSIIMAIAIFLMATSPGFPSYLDNLYPKTALTRLQTIYKENIQWNFDNVLLKSLTPSERRKLGNVIVQFPLIAPKQDSPMSFYAVGSPQSIVVPVLSVKFFDDLAIASTWLMVNGYSQETVLNYMSMIKYKSPRQFPGGRCPPPLEALQIPSDALKDTRVDEISKMITRSAVVFVLAHELGHLYYHHPGYDIPVAMSQRNELQADEFALNLLRRAGVPPMGISNFFLAALYLGKHRGDFASDNDWENYLRTKSTHPLTSKRLRLVSANLRKNARDFASAEPNPAQAVKVINYVADQVDGITKILDDYRIHQVIAHLGRTTDLESLTPRHEGEIRPVLTEKRRTTVTDEAFSGVYSGEFSILKTNERIPIMVQFTRRGQNVIGVYNYGAGKGQIKGILQGDTLFFNWSEGGVSGKGKFIVQHGGKAFQGTWGFKESSVNGGNWSGQQ